MAAVYCICPICGEKFDRNKIQAVRYGARRYAHATCDPDNTDFVPMEEKKVKATKAEKKDAGGGDPDLASLKDYISTLFDYVNWPLVTKQIKNYHDKEGYSYSGIEKSLRYFYDIKHGSKDKANGGIGIVPYTYQEAYNYYLAIFMAQQGNNDKMLVTEVQEYVIAPPKKKGNRSKLLEWEFDYNGEEE